MIYSRNLAVTRSKEGREERRLIRPLILTRLGSGIHVAKLVSRDDQSRQEEAQEQRV